MVSRIKKRGYEAITTQEVAREIMGANFFGIEEAVKYLGVNLSKKETTALIEIPFTEEVLESCKDTHVLAAVFLMSILDIRKVDSSLFDRSTGGWYNSEEFAQNKGMASWQLILKNPVPDSTSKKLTEQQDLLGKDDETLSTQPLIYMMIGHYRNTGERLFENVYVRTSCALLDGRHVGVGYFDSGGLLIYGFWDNTPYANLGLSSAWKF